MIIIDGVAGLLIRELSNSSLVVDDAVGVVGLLDEGVDEVVLLLKLTPDVLSLSSLVNISFDSSSDLFTFSNEWPYLTVVVAEVATSTL